MIDLPKTQHSLFELQSAFDFQSGLHGTDALRPSMSGISVGQVDFDPSKHELSMVDPSAESIDDQHWPQVQIVRPYNRLGLNIMAYANLSPTAVDYLSAIDSAKRVMAIEIAGSLGRLRLSGDRTRLLVIGRADAYEDLPQAEVVDYSSSPSKATAQIVDRSKRSELNFLESDFVLLDPDDLPRSGKTVALKINHPLELRLPANRGRFSLGGLVECNTNKPKELAETNRILDARHRAILAKLAARGIEVLSLSYDPNFPSGVNPNTLDSQLSVTVDKLAKTRN